MSSTISTKPMRKAASNGISQQEIQERVARIRNSWSPAERARRAQLGRARRETLLTTLGFSDQKSCA